MSTLWTPSGERPVGRSQPAPESPPSPPPSGAGSADAEAPLTDEQLAAEMAEAQRRLAETPARVMVANHCIGLFQLAVLHLEQEPPNLAEAQLAIDAMAAVVEGLGTRLGDDHQALRDALAQLRLGFVQRKGAAGA